MNREEIIEWLLQGDPSIRWQVKRDLIKENENAILKERERVNSEGWGKKLLSFQDENGKWSGQLYNGKWISTTYSLLILMNLGIVPNSKTKNACHQLFHGGLYNDEEIRFSSKQKLRDNGLMGLVLGILCYFGYDDQRVHNIADYLIRSQNPDGSWISDDKEGAEKYCFENTMLILKEISEYLKKYPGSNPKIDKSIRKGQEFLLKYNLFQNPLTNLPINNKWLKISFPYYWFYDILVGLEYFWDMDFKDRRLEPAIKIIKKKQNKYGTWNLENKHPGRTFFEMEEVGKPSRWITLRCLRIIEWWENRHNCT